MDQEFKIIIEDMIKDIYGIRFVQVKKNFNILVDGLINLSTNLHGEDKIRLNELMNKIINSIENKDYLLLSDILTFDLLSILENEINEEVGLEE